MTKIKKFFSVIYDLILEFHCEQEIKKIERLEKIKNSNKKAP